MEKIFEIRWSKKKKNYLIITEEDDESYTEFLTNENRQFNIVKNNVLFYIIVGLL